MQVFVSYKSEDSNVVREVVETLISGGVPVWLAEYEVLPSQYDVFDDDLETHLQNAVRGCTHALVFTNNRWSESDYCRTEMKAINAAAIPAQNIIEVRIPHQDLPHREYPILEHGPTLDYAQDPAATAASVLKLLGISPVPILAAVPSEKHSLRLWRFGLALAPGPFQLRLNRRESTRASLTHGGPAVLFRSELNGQPVKLVVVLRAFDSVLRSLEISQTDSASDREVYRAYRQYAANWEKGQVLRICGLHLFFWNGRSQLALTYVTPHKDSGQFTAVWERRYVLSPRGVAPAERGEIHFLFYADLAGSKEQQFRRFTSLCPIFEGIVQSVRYCPVTGKEDLISSIPLVFVRLLYLIGCGWGAFLVAGNPDRAEWALLLGVVMGTIGADLAAVLYSRVYRQVLWTVEALPYEDSLEGIYERISIGIAREVTWYLLTWAWVYAMDCIFALSPRKGSLRLPGPGLIWLLLIWLLLASHVYPAIGLACSNCLGFFAALLVGTGVTLRFVAYRLGHKNWHELELN